MMTALLSAMEDLREVFVPFLGDFFSIMQEQLNAIMALLFSSPFSGTFFQSDLKNAEKQQAFMVFVPFLGDFFSIISISLDIYIISYLVFVPFLGDFFSIGRSKSIPDV